MGHTVSSRDRVPRCSQPVQLTVALTYAPLLHEEPLLASLCSAVGVDHSHFLCSLIPTSNMEFCFNPCWKGKMRYLMQKDPEFGSLYRNLDSGCCVAALFLLCRAPPSLGLGNTCFLLQKALLPGTAASLGACAEWGVSCVFCAQGSEQLCCFMHEGVSRASVKDQRAGVSCWFMTGFLDA